jgi:hypothetical protein
MDSTCQTRYGSNEILSVVYGKGSEGARDLSVGM